MLNKSTLIATAATITLSAVMISPYSHAATIAAGNGNYSKPEHYKTDNWQYSENPNYIYHKRKKSDIEISCKEGRLIVARQGFEDVHTLKCQGRNFTYVAMLDGEVLRVRVNRRGDIVDATHF